MPSMIRNTVLHRRPSLTISYSGRTVRLAACRSNRTDASAAIGGRVGNNLWLRGVFGVLGRVRPAADCVATVPPFGSANSLRRGRCIVFAPAIVAFLPQRG